jgi:hypothetical protein
VSGPLQRNEERWALVPANVRCFRPRSSFNQPNQISQQSTHNVTTNQAQADADLTQALEISIRESYSMEVDSFREIDHTENIRTGSKPVALRARELNHVFAALLLQALYHVPQIRSVIRVCTLDASNSWLNDSMCGRVSHRLRN